MAAEIPVIDVTEDKSGEPAGNLSTAAKLVNAAADNGFIYIRHTGRGWTSMDVEGAFNISRILFGSPIEEMKRCTIKRDNRGWSGMHTETLDPRTQKVGDYKEAFNFGEFVDGRAQQPLPSSIITFEAAINLFRESCHALCRRILHLLGLGLQLDNPDFFSSAHDPKSGPSGSILRLLRYPTLADSPGAADGDIRAGAHSDYGSVTLLFRLKGQAGLQILTRSGSWAPVPVHPPGTESDPYPPILVNIGDLLSYWTNGLFRSTVHRVVFDPAHAAETDRGARYSIAYFGHPVDDTPLTAVPSERVAGFVDADVQKRQNPYAQRTVLTAKEHLLIRLSETYGDLYASNES